jgi:2-methylcitrate dehydratase PrpD
MGSDCPAARHLGRVAFMATDNSIDSPQEAQEDAIEALLRFGLETRYEDLPFAIVERAKMAVLDVLGATIAGIRGEGVAELSSLAHEWGGALQATDLTNGKPLPLPLAGLVNGVAARAWDLDDVHERNRCHVSANIVPAALAVAQARGPVSGKEFLTSIVVGTELICRLARAPLLGFSATGSSVTYQCGFYGAALTASRLMGLSLSQTRHALGIAHARVAGNQQGNIESAMTVKLMQGIAVEGGLLSALMAEKGLGGARQILEGRFGYYAVYQRGQYDRSHLVDGLGSIWHQAEISLKPESPCCRFTHAFIEAAIEARQSFRDTERSDQVMIEMSEADAYSLVCTPSERRWHPTTLTDAQFSLPFVMAHALVHGVVNLQSFQPDGLQDPEVAELMGRISVSLREPKVDVNTPGDRVDSVAIRTTAGRFVSGKVRSARGHPSNPSSFEDVLVKFKACCAFGRPAWSGADAVAEEVRRMEQTKNVATLVHLLHP